MTRMFRQFSSRLIASVLILCALVLAQTGDGVYSQSLAYGNKTLISLPRYRVALAESTPLRIGLRSGRYVSRIGGVTFETVATPTPGLSIASISLTYNPSKWDGQRFATTINGREYLLPEYDWQLIPIVQFAESNSTACFTLFGSLSDPELQRALQLTPMMTGGEPAQIVSFHSAFQDTLVGLRLFQLDQMLFDPNAYDLPRTSTGAVLGKGEAQPNIEGNRAAVIEFSKSFESQKKLLGGYDSYVINDLTKVRFALNQGRLELTGQPFVHLFRYGPDNENDAPIYNKQLSEWVWRNSNILRNINPHAWDNGIKVMRYAAFFRYCKRTNPSAWATLVASTANVKVSPSVQTPDVSMDTAAWTRLNDAAKQRSIRRD
jgi:hypothetical protein